MSPSILSTPPPVGFLLPLYDSTTDADHRLQISELPSGEMKAALSGRVAPQGAVGVLQLTLLCRSEARMPMPAEDLLAAVADWAESLARACREELLGDLPPPPVATEVL